VMFFLVDCNNFFVSCELVFHPHLKGKPVVVLSNNDGCIIARSNEAKKMGIKMGDPVFLHKKALEEKKVFAFSANFHLYGNLSTRVHEILKKFPFQVENYSIDEAFLFTPKKDPLELLSCAQTIKETILQWTGLPVSIGISSTKTLAKLAIESAKKYVSNIYLIDEEKRIDHLKKTPIEDIWGVGRQLKEKLENQNIYTAYHLMSYDLKRLKKLFSISMQKTALELQGHSAFSLEEFKKKSLTITSSRSYATPLKTYQELKAAISYLVDTASRKLRKEKLVSAYLTLYITTSRFEKNIDQYYSNFYSVNLSPPSSYTGDLLKAAQNCLKVIFKEAYSYKKAGILLENLIDEKNVEYDLFFSPALMEKKSRLSKAYDQIQEKYQKKALYYASENPNQTWKKKAYLRSSNFTGNWNEILKVK
jgi:DNA polymerase V